MMSRQASGFELPETTSFSIVSPCGATWKIIGD
jgi:hypothetical protein